MTSPTPLRNHASLRSQYRGTLAFLASFAVAAAFAGEIKDDIKAAAKALAEKPNYTWTSETEGTPFPMSPLEGRAEKGGFTLISQDMNGNTLTAVLKGTNGAVKLADGWKTAAELPQPNFGGGGPPDFSAMIGRRLLTAKAPAAEVADLVDKVKELKTVNGRFEGELTEEGAASLMPFGRRPPGGAPGGAGAPPAPSIKGTVRVWLKDGALWKYEVATDITMQTPMGEMNMSPTTVVRLKDIGTTKVEVPAEARQKLESK